MVFIVSMNINDYSGSILENREKIIHKLTKKMIKSSFNGEQKCTTRLSKRNSHFKYFLLIFEFQSMKIDILIIYQ